MLLPIPASESICEPYQPLGRSGVVVALPRHIRALTRPVAAKDYWTAGRVRRHIATSFNALLIDRQEIKVHQSPVDLMIREMSDIYSLIVFPEGGRAEGEEMASSKAVCIIWEKSDQISS